MPNRNSKSDHAKRRSAERKAAQQRRGSKKFQAGSNVHQGASRGQSGQPKR